MYADFSPQANLDRRRQAGQAEVRLPKLPVRAVLTDDNRLTCIVSQNADAMTVVLLDSIFL